MYWTNRKISECCHSPLILLKCIGCKNMYILLPFNFIFAPKPSNFECKSLGLKTIETIAIIEKTIADTI